MTVNVLVTGASGFVASYLIPELTRNSKVYGIDLIPSEFSDMEISIADRRLSSFLEKLAGDEIYIVNLAASRFDFGAKATQYYSSNVECHAEFLALLSPYNVTKFIHVSSVASLDGRDIPFLEELECDDAYRSTKFLQEALIKNWCDKQGIELSIVYPSAIFSRDSRSDTNIGKLQSISKFLPFAPAIDVVKSLTYLPNLSRFIVDLVEDKVPMGKYLTFEKPLLTVSEMIQLISGRSIYLIRIPYLHLMLKMAANVLYVLGGAGKIDLKLTPNRVVKLFSDTSYSHVDDKELDSSTYALRSKAELTELLRNQESV